MRAWLAALTLILALPARAFTFGVLGDTPYSALDVLALRSMLAEIDKQDLAFLVHVGDIKAGGEPCTDALLTERRDLLARSRAPLVFVPGDNEWTDCWRPSNGRFDPLERLAKLRTLFFPPALTLGRGNVPGILSQAAQPRSPCPRCVEHLRWVREGVMFVTLNIPGSNNNLERDVSMDDESRTRMQSVRAWLDAAVTEAIRADARALVIIFHGNPGFERSRLAAPTARPDGYVDLRRQLASAARRFQRPVLVFHGDTHLYKDDHPLVDAATGVHIANLRRVEVMGYPFLGWAKVEVRDTPGEAVFNVTPIRAVNADR